MQLGKVLHLVVLERFFPRPGDHLCSVKEMFSVIQIGVFFNVPVAQQLCLKCVDNLTDEHATLWVNSRRSLARLGVAQRNRNKNRGRWFNGEMDLW